MEHCFESEKDSNGTLFKVKGMRMEHYFDRERVRNGTLF